MSSGKPSKTTSIRDLAKILEQLSQESTAKDVHRLRTTIRRVQSRLDLSGLEDGEKYGKVLKKLRTVFKRAGKVRDADIHLSILKDIRAGNGDREELRASLEERRQRSLARLVKEKKGLAGKKTRERLQAILQGLGRTVEKLRQEEVLMAARNELAKLAEGFSGKDLEDPDTLHALRIMVKRARYKAEVAAETSAEAAALVEGLKQVQDAIGDWHDHNILHGLAGEEAASPQSALVAELRTMTAARHLIAVQAGRTVLAQAASFAAPRKRPHSAGPSAYRQIKVSS